MYRDTNKTMTGNTLLGTMQAQDNGAVGLKC